MQSITVELSDHTYSKLVSYCESQNISVEEGMHLLIDRQIKHHQNNEIFLGLVESIKDLESGATFNVKEICQAKLGETNDAITLQRKLASFITGKKIARPYDPWGTGSHKHVFERC